MKGQIRIITGQFGGRTISTPVSHATHPMSERARAGIFNVLISQGFNFDDVKVLDLFAGSGALGFEALSRGASSVVLVDKNRSVIDTFHKNMKQLSIPKEKILFLPKNVFGFKGDTDFEFSTRREGKNASILEPSEAEKPNRRFDLVFCDPPYGDFAEISDKLVDLFDDLRTSDNAFLVLSRPSNSTFLELRNWRSLGAKKYAEATIDFYERKKDAK